MISQPGRAAVGVGATVGAVCPDPHSDTTSLASEASFSESPAPKCPPPGAPAQADEGVSFTGELRAAAAAPPGPSPWPDPEQQKEWREAGDPHCKNREEKSWGEGGKEGSPAD